MASSFGASYQEREREREREREGERENPVDLAELCRGDPLTLGFGEHVSIG